MFIVHCSHVHCYCNALQIVTFHIVRCCHSIFIAFMHCILIAFVHCRFVNVVRSTSLCIVIVVHCSLCTKYWSLLLSFIVPCYLDSFVLCIVNVYYNHCSLLFLFVVQCYLNVLCIVIVHCYHCSLLFVTM